MFVNLIRIVTLFCALLLASQTLAGETNPQDLRALVPLAKDYTSMWWVDGFPTRVPKAPWHRCIQTGYYALVLDTETLQIPHFGPLPGRIGYADLARSTNRDWTNLPAAELTLQMKVGDQIYRCTGSKQASRFTGPRLIESGRFMQRADVTDLVFTTDDGERLNCQTRFEIAAWPDRLSLILAARPGTQAIAAGDACFGRVGGGYGLDGSNHLEIPNFNELDSEQFTMEFWVFVPTDYQAAKNFPWLVCKNPHEQADGNFGITIHHDVSQARMNIGGGRDNAYVTESSSKESLKLEAWNHLAISYDGDMLRLFANGKLSGETKVGRRRTPVAGTLVFGKRNADVNNAYHFRGVIDEVRFYDRALTLKELRLHHLNPEVVRPALKPVRAWTFRTDVAASMTKLSE